MEKEKEYQRSISTSSGNTDQDAKGLYGANGLNSTPGLNKVDANKGQTAYSKPIIAVGLKTALDGTQLDATDFHGADGLGGVHEKRGHFSAPEKWVELFSFNNNTNAGEDNDTNTDTSNLPFVPSTLPSYSHILKLLAAEPPHTVVIIAIGPLMNLAKAAAIDPVTFARVRQVVVMGGAISVPGNVTPFAEFNVFSDAIAAKNVFEMTGVNGLRNGNGVKGGEKDEQEDLSIKLTLLPLDLTTRHTMYQKDFHFLLDKLKARSAVLKSKSSLSPLVDWTSVWLQQTFDTYYAMAGYDMKSEEWKSENLLGIQMHDPLAVWYGICRVSDDNKEAIKGSSNETIYKEEAFIEEHYGSTKWVVEKDVDLRVESQGKLTSGMTVRDRRLRPKREDDIHNDHNEWLKLGKGNRVEIVTEAFFNGEESNNKDGKEEGRAKGSGVFGRLVLETIFGEKF